METLFIVLIAMVAVLIVTAFATIAFFVFNKKKAATTQSEAPVVSAPDLNNNNELLQKLVELTANLKNSDENLKSFQTQTNLKNQEVNNTIIDVVDKINKAIAQQNEIVADKIFNQSQNLIKTLDKNKNETYKILFDQNQNFNQSVQKQSQHLNKEIQSLSENVNQKVTNSYKELKEEFNNYSKTLKDEMSKKINEEISKFGEKVNLISSDVNQLASLRNDLSEIRKIFEDNKTRGIFGEKLLENYLNDAMPNGYKSQFQLSNKKQDKVDIAIPINVSDNNQIYIPIDSKFNLESYRSLLDYIDANKNELDFPEQQKAINNLWKNIKAEIMANAKSISEKYIIEGITTNVAFMFIPSESIYLELVKYEKGSLVDEIRKKYNIELISPSLVMVLVSIIKDLYSKFNIGIHNKDIVHLIKKFDDNADKVIKSTAALFKKQSSYLQELEKWVKTVNDAFSTYKKEKTKITSKKRLSEFERIEKTLTGETPESLIVEGEILEIE